MVAAESTTDTQMVTPLLTRFLVAFSAPTIDLKHWTFAHNCRAPVRECESIGNISSSPIPCQLYKPSTRADPDQMIQVMYSSLAKLTAQFTISLQWVPAHVGLTGKERADRLPKIGSLAPQRQNPVTYRDAKTRLHSRFHEDWKKENGGYRAHRDPVWRLERAKQTTISNLRTGHCGLNPHLKRIGILDTSLCECTQADQTPDHVL